MLPASAYPDATSVEQLRTRLAAVRGRIDAACARVGRDPAAVTLLPVSKTVPEERLRLAYAAGCRALGENKAQELARKAGNMADLPDLDWVLIGHLQTNKVPLAARFASSFQALDSMRLAAALERRLQVEGRALDVLVQVNTSGEQSKYGLPPEQVPAFVRELAALDSLRVRGLMTLALFTDDTERVRRCFIALRELRDRLRNDAHGSGVHELSMGMSGDYDLAVEEGATIVRVGQAIFGARSLPDSHYWPGVDDGPSGPTGP